MAEGAGRDWKDIQEIVILASFPGNHRVVRWGLVG